MRRVDERFYDRGDAHIRLANAKEETISYFVTEYRKRLEENPDDYVLNFDQHMGTKE